MDKEVKKFEIQTYNLGKRFGRQHVFVEANLNFCTSNPAVIIGANGSGKSSLLMCLMGYLSPSSGQIHYNFGGKILQPSDIFMHLSFVAPYIQLLEEMSLLQVIHFHFSFKKMLPDYTSAGQIAEFMMLESHLHKPITQFSSGMKQRLKLGLAFAADTPLIFLDEPCATLDRQTIGWYQTNARLQSQRRLMILASNNPEEYTFCENIIDIENIKYSVK